MDAVLPSFAPASPAFVFLLQDCFYRIMHDTVVCWRSIYLLHSPQDVCLLPSPQGGLINPGLPATPPLFEMPQSLFVCSVLRDPAHLWAHQVSILCPVCIPH